MHVWFYLRNITILIVKNTTVLDKSYEKLVPADLVLERKPWQHIPNEIIKQFTNKCKANPTKDSKGIQL